MEKLNIKLENCYGIKKLDFTFDFEKSNVYSIYAPNGTMKTSFTKTFQNLIKGETPIDRINQIDGEYTICSEATVVNNFENFLSIKSMDLKFEPKEISSLIVNESDKEEYDKIFVGITKAKDNLIKELASKSKITKAQVERFFLNDFGQGNTNFIEFLKSIILGLKIDDDLSEINYKSIFLEPKVLEILENPEFATKIEEYNGEYNKIVNDVDFFEKGKFTPYKANVLLKAVKEQNLYGVEDNGLILAKKNLLSYSELETEINGSLELIEKNSELKAIKEKISVWTKPLQEFNKIMENNGDKVIIALSKGLEDFKKEIWKSYLIHLMEPVNELIKLYDSGLVEMQRIQGQANIENTEWKKLVTTFEQRFYVPFKIDIEDSINTILGTKEPVIVFKHYNELNGEYDIIHKKNELIGLNILSGGEQRALYLLYVLFEIETRKNKGEQIFIIDDIADSFDYKNKYAIIEYLQELSEDKNFKLIILTHNFDFYRSVQMRLAVQKGETLEKSANLSVIAKGGTIEIVNGTNYLDPIKYFKDNYQTCNYQMVALITIARNLADYLFGTEDEEYYLKLTSMMHMKKDNFNVGDLNEILNFFFQNDYDVTSEIQTCDLIQELCNDIICSGITEKLELEKKIVLSIGIRLEAEKFMIKKLGGKIEEIEKVGNQTRGFYNDCKKEGLFVVYKNGEEDEIDEEKIIKKVLLMTPEAIHLNSFMYEPILDISDEHLMDLYVLIYNLNNL